MAIVVRYFSTTGAGAEDGTTWADRAPFISGGAYNTIITAFDFSGSDSLEARLGPGTYTAPANLAGAIFSVAQPRPANPLFIHGCDSSGNRIDPDLDWNCAQSALDVTGYPVLDLTASYVITQLSLRMRCVSITGARSGTQVAQIASGMFFDFCKLENTASNDFSRVIDGGGGLETITNCHMICSGTSYTYITNALGMVNCRLEGNSSATSGARHGCRNNLTGAILRGPICVINTPGSGVVNNSTGNNTGIVAIYATIVGCGKGVEADTGSGATTGTAGYLHVDRCFIANCTTGIDAVNASAYVFNNRLRNTTDLSIPTNSCEGNNLTASGSDTDEFVDAANGDYRIKSTSIYWGKGIGAGDEPASGGGSKPVNPFTQTVIA